MIFEFRGEELTLGIEKFLYLSKYNVLVISDLHFGKLEHFRKHGIGVPSGLDDHDHKKLKDLLSKYQPDICIFLGDLFHSEYNQSWDLFANALYPFINTKFILTEGNHDILKPDYYKKLNIDVVSEIEIGKFVFSHHPTPIEGDKYNIHGHIHPGISLHGKGRQSVRLACYYFGEKIGIMPAFGRFTGLATVSKNVGDRVIAITSKSLIEV